MAGAAALDRGGSATLDDAIEINRMIGEPVLCSCGVRLWPYILIRSTQIRWEVSGFAISGAPSSSPEKEASKNNESDARPCKRKLVRHDGEHARERIREK